MEKGKILEFKSTKRLERRQHNAALQSEEHMRCPFCKRDMKEWDLKRLGYLIVTKDVKKVVHVHGSIKGKAIVREFIEAIKRECGLRKRN